MLKSSKQNSSLLIELVNRISHFELCNRVFTMSLNNDKISREISEDKRRLAGREKTARLHSARSTVKNFRILTLTFEYTVF